MQDSKLFDDAGAGFAELAKLRSMSPAKRGAGRLARAVCCALCLFAVAVSSKLSSYYAQPLKASGGPLRSDAIVLMSHGQFGSEWLSLVGAQRTLGALKLYREGYATTIISSGSNPPRWDQAALQAAWLQQAGVPASAIVVEDASRRTRDSAVHVARIMKERGWRSLVVVVSELDAPRVRMVFRKEKLEPSFLEVPESGPSVDLFGRGYPAVFWHATYEYLGLVFYRWKGWI